MPSVLNYNTLSMQVSCLPNNFLLSGWIHVIRCCCKRNHSPAVYNPQPYNRIPELTLQTENTSSPSKATRHQGKKKKGEHA